MSDWFETVAEAQRRARKSLPHSVYGAIVAGSEQGVSRDDNVEAFGEIGFAPRVADLAAERALHTTVLGHSLSMPVLISPTGVQAVHPEAEVALAAAAASRGIAMGLSSFASRPVEQVIEANEQTILQMYWLGERDEMIARMERARAAGVRAIILTLDWSFAHGRDWGSPSIPERVDVRTMLKHAPEACLRPRWLMRFLRNKTLPDLRVPNLVDPGDAGPTFFEAYGQWMQTPPPKWSDVAWLRSQWDGPFMVKGICRVDDAHRAVDAGATAISVSNHGGNNLDGTPAPIRCLASIVDAVGDEAEVVLDGGIRRGSDVVKALALGARATMTGRAGLWGLAANGQAGVENVLDILRQGIDSTLLAIGAQSVEQLHRGDVVVGDHFHRTLGAA